MEYPHQYPDYDRGHDLSRSRLGCPCIGPYWQQVRSKTRLDCHCCDGYSRRHLPGRLRTSRALAPRKDHAGRYVEQAHLVPWATADHLILAAIGLASNFVPVYQSEVAPTQYRGIMISLYQLGINIGGLVGTCINQGTHAMPTRQAYRIPLYASLSFPVILLVVTLFLPESPRELP